jgi:rhamnogalacturonyl hydrolase YesR
MRKSVFLASLIIFLHALPMLPQTAASKITDSNTALHALQPEYPVPYGPGQLKKLQLFKACPIIDASTPAKMIDRKTKAVINDNSKLSADAVFEPGVFRLISYEWGVVYGAMLSAGEATGDPEFNKYTLKRMNLIGSVSQYFKNTSGSSPDATPVRSVLDPRALDDAGSMCAAMIKTYNISKDETLLPLIENYTDYISSKQQRLSDGTLARNRPLPDALGGDLYMSVPALAQMGKLQGDKKYYDDACKQILQFSQHMFNEEKGLYMHGWIQGMEPHPEFYWARCNGWAILAMSELLDVLPSGHPDRNKILNRYNAHIKGIVPFQSCSGLWHQLLDRNDSYL